MAKDKAAKEAYKRVTEITDTIAELLREAEKLADEHGFSFYVSGNDNTYHGKGSPDSDGIEGWEHSSSRCW
jgi:hypothetical protein